MNLENLYTIKEMKNFNEKIAEYFGSFYVFAVWVACHVLSVVTIAFSVGWYLNRDGYLLIDMIEHIGYNVLAMVCLCIQLVMSVKFKMRIPKIIHIAVAVFIVAHFSLGSTFRWYDTLMIGNLTVFDKILHLVGGLIIVALGFSFAHSFSNTKKTGSVKLSPFFLAVFAFCFAMTILVIWEFVEFAMDSFFDMTSQRWHDGLLTNPDGTFRYIDIEGIRYYYTSVLRGSGLMDTMLDLLYGALGAAITAVLGGYFIKKNPDYTGLYIISKKKLAAAHPAERDIELDNADYLTAKE
jgi:hypothetical protein